MALPIATYKAQIQAIKNTFPELAQILFAEEGGSKVGSFNLEADTMAQALGIQGQLFDAYQAELIAIANSAVPTTDQWVQDEIFKFQYSDSNPQYVQLIKLIPTYPIVDESLQIISRCSATTLSNGIVSVKVATGTSPVALSNNQLAALKAYCKIIFGGGVISLFTGDSDKLAIDAQVYYDGQFISSIQSDVEQAINNKLASIPFNGIISKSDIELAIRAVLGVSDVVINKIMCRQDSVAYSGTDSGRRWSTIAGYIVEETTSGHTFADTITYTAE